jgi:hypothetical protein
LTGKKKKKKQGKEYEERYLQEKDAGFTGYGNV